MTCFEKYKQMYDGEEPDVNSQCPNRSGGITIDDPPFCDCGRSDECSRCWNREAPDTEPVTEPVTSTVDHPKHYGREGGMECIDEMLLIFGVEATMHFCLLNAWKYRYRAPDKNGAEDMAKSDWYITKYAELKGGD